MVLLVLLFGRSFQISLLRLKGSDVVNLYGFIMGCLRNKSTNDTVRHSMCSLTRPRTEANGRRETPKQI